MAMTRAVSDGPLMEINTTPLIDVMLVLLIMFIITIPAQNHAVKLDVPQPGNGPVSAVSNQIDIDLLGNLYWNKAEVNLPTLKVYLQQAVALRSEPELRLHPDALAQYGLVDLVMATAQRAGVTKMSFVGNEAYAS